MRHTQRSEINEEKKNPTEYLIKEWLLLFTWEGFLNHLHLVGIDIAEKFHSAWVSKGCRISKYVETKPAGCSKMNEENMLKKVDLPEEITNTCEYVIFLMMAYFQEKWESLFITADVSDSNS